MINLTSSDQCKAQILVIEDNPDHWSVTEWALSERFPEVEPIWKATDQAALLYLEQQRKSRQPLPVLVLLDLYLPKREQGWILLETLKTHYIYRSLAVIILSSSDNVEDIKESYFLRTNAYMVKPVGGQAWLDEIEQLRRYWWQANRLLIE